MGDAAGIEEERRLAYVAITRARKKLFLTCAYARQIFGQTSSNPISRFIQEIPSELRQTTGPVSYTHLIWACTTPSAKRRYSRR